MGATIVIVGEHLGSVNEILFNDIKAALNPTMISSTNIIVTVPSAMPSEITNTLTLKTLADRETVYKLGLNIPAPELNSISNEWAKDGDTVVITGRYFFANESNHLEQVLFAGNLEAKIISFTQNSATVVVPAGALAGAVTLTSIYGTGRSEFTFRDATGIFIDGENPSAWNWWGRGDFSDVDGTSGAYVYLHGAGGSWAWPGDQMQLLYFRNDALLPSSANPGDYALRFEFKSTSWRGPNMVMWFDNTGKGDIDDGTIAQCHFAPYTEGTNYVTGWHTVTIPLSDFKYNKEMSVSNLVISDPSTVQNFFIFPFGNGEVAPFDVKLDNLRLIKIK
jgi:hypothetical protein